MKKILILLFLAVSAFSANDTVRVLHPGDTLKASEPLVVFTQPQFQTVVANKQQLKTDSITIIQLNKIVSNNSTKDSLLLANASLQDSITNKYKSLYNATAAHEAKLEAPSFWDSKIIWFILGLFVSYFGAEEYNFIK